MSDKTNLFTPLPIRNVILRNRIAVSPMCQYSCEDGFANDWHLVHLGSRAVGGAGLVILEASAVDPRGRISAADLGIWKNEHVPMLSRIADFIKKQGAVPGIQIAHAGRKASCSEPWKGGHVLLEGGWQTIAPSPLPFNESNPLPKALTREEITTLTQSFVDAAKRALKAGFEILELHAAHGYLLHQFLSPLSNLRTDEYGGTFENRIRFLLEVTDAVRRAWPEHLPLFVRISATDWFEGGWTIDDSVELAVILKNHGVDLIDCSSGGLVPHARIPIAPGYQVSFSEKIKREASMATGAVGLITQPEQANEIILSSKADLIFLARELLRSPYWPLHAAQTLGVIFPAPLQYQRAFAK